MLFPNTIVGPIRSRRLGSSLGVNLLPIKHKHCSYDCIYCECGWNRESEQQELVYATPEEISQALEERLQSLTASGIEVDSFTFAGNGEPTLYPQFPEMVDVVVRLRDKYYPNAVTTLLTNATQLVKPEIFEAVQRLDNPVLKLDAGTAAMRDRINKPNDKACSWDELIKSLVRFGNRAIIQTLLFDGQSNGELVSNLIDEEFTPYLALLQRINPRYVMLYALDRETPEQHLRKLPLAEIEQYAKRIEQLGIETKCYG